MDVKKQQILAKYACLSIAGFVLVIPDFGDSPGKPISVGSPVASATRMPRVPCQEPVCPLDPWTFRPGPRRSFDEKESEEPSGIKKSSNIHEIVGIHLEKSGFSICWLFRPEAFWEFQLQSAQYGGHSERNLPSWGQRKAIGSGSHFTSRWFTQIFGTSFAHHVLDQSVCLATNGSLLLLEKQT